MQFLTINFIFSLLRVLTLAHDSMSLNFYTDLLFGSIILSHAWQDRYKREITTKHNIQKIHIHIFHKKLRG